MIGTKREKRMGAATGIVLLILALDQLLLSPYMNERDRLVSEQQQVLVERQRAREILRRWEELSSGWDEYFDGEIQSGYPGTDENRVIKAVRDWAEESGITLSLLRPEAVQMHGDFQEKTFNVSGNGPLRSISKFLWFIESAEIPVKVKDMQLSSRREGTDDLAFNIRVGELSMPDYLAGSAVKPSVPTNGSRADNPEDLEEM